MLEACLKAYLRERGYTAEIVYRPNALGGRTTGKEEFFEYLTQGIECAQGLEVEFQTYASIFPAPVNGEVSDVLFVAALKTKNDTVCIKPFFLDEPSDAFQEKITEEIEVALQKHPRPWTCNKERNGRGKNQDTLALIETLAEGITTAQDSTATPTSNREKLN